MKPFDHLPVYKADDERNPDNPRHIVSPLEDILGVIVDSSLLFLLYTLM
jgi:hypothetical protein